MNESVELVRRARLERAVPFTNAVLRRVGDGIERLLAELPEGPLKHSYPDWVWDVWRRDLGEEAALALMRAQNEPPPTVVRHVRGPVPDGAPTDIPGAYEVARVDEKALQRGEIWPQSRGSQLAGLVVGSQDGERVLDLCAAPGGKTTMLAGEVTAVEANEARARELEENVDRLGAGNVRVVHADGRSLPPELTGFDRALVDAPCSGLGVLAARPDLRWRSQPLPELQLELLRAAAERVRPGGTIVYSVCTINADEAEGVVDASGLAVEPIEGWAQFRHPSRPEFLQTLPHVHGTSGFFIARLRSRAVGSPRGLARLGADGRDRAVALRGGLLATRRADRASRARGRARLPLRRRRRALRPAGDDRPGRAALDRAARSTSSAAGSTAT